MDRSSEQVQEERWVVFTVTQREVERVARVWPHEFTQQRRLSVARGRDEARNPRLFASIGCNQRTEMRTVNHRRSPSLLLRRGRTL